jgi:Ser-tRNA(Ala) deacylase AlaX
MKLSKVKKIKQLGPIKIIDFDKNKSEEKKRVKLMEKKGMKNMKIRFFS